MQAKARLAGIGRRYSSCLSLSTNTSVSRKGDTSGRAIETKLGNGLVESRDFDPRSGRLYSVTVSKEGKPVLYHAYGYSPRQLLSNRVVFWDTTSFVEDFTYDPLGRVKSSKIQDTLEEYRYDDAGNLTHKSNLGTGDYTYFKQGLGAGTLPHAVKTLPGDPTPFEYDLNGNLMKGASRRFEWKSFNMPSSISKGSYSSAFVYGPEHQRVRQERTGGGDANSIEYLGNQEVESINNVVSATRSYWPMGLGLDVDKEGGESSALWTHVDALGSVIAVSDATGTIRERLAYDTWGKRRTLKGLPENGTATPDEIDGELDRTGYTGEEMLDQLDLVHLNGRVYDPAIGRFTSADPYIADWRDGQSLNHYSYVLNSPMNYTDPSGYIPEIVINGQRESPGTLGGGGGGGGVVGSAPSISYATPAVVTVRGRSTSANSDQKYVFTTKQTTDPVFGTPIITSNAHKVENYADQTMGGLIGLTISGPGERLLRDAGASENQAMYGALILGMANPVGRTARLAESLVAKEARALAKPIYKTTKEAKAAAEALGFKKINETVHDGQAVFKRNKDFITRDVDGHNGGAWKMADSVENLGSKETRAGTFDVNLNRIGD